MTSILPNASGKPPIYGKLMWIVFFAFAVRVAVRGLTGESDFWENGYTFFFALAQNIADGNGLAFEGGPATAFRVPLYPMFLAAVTFGYQAFLPVLLAQSLIGAGTVLCGALIARELFGNSAAIIAGALTAIYPYYVVHDTALQETSLYTFVTALAMLLLLRVRRSGSGVNAACAGLTIGAAVLTRVNLMPLAVLAPMWLAIPNQCCAKPIWQRLRVALVCATMVALTVSPWLIRSYFLTGSATLSTEIGFSLWIGNNNHTFSHYPHESIDLSERAGFEALSPEE